VFDWRIVIDHGGLVHLGTAESLAAAGEALVLRTADPTHTPMLRTMVNSTQLRVEVDGDDVVINTAEPLLQQSEDGLSLEALVGVTDPSDPDDKTWEDGSLLPNPHATLAGPTVEAWLDSDDADTRTYGVC